MSTTLNTTLAEPPLHEFFGRDPDSYNIDLDVDDTSDTAPDGSGRPGLRLVSAAIAFWVGQVTAAQRDAPTIGQCAATFVMPAEAVLAAVDDHPYLFTDDDGDTPIRDLTIWQDSL